MNTRLRYILFSLFCFLLIPEVVMGQEESIDSSEDEIVSISQIVEEIESTTKNVRSIEEQMLASQSLQNFYKELPALVDSLARDLGTMDSSFFNEMSFQMVENTRPELNDYEETVVGYKKRVSERLDLIQMNILALEKESNKWLDVELTYRNDVTINALLKERLMPLLKRINIALERYQVTQKNELKYFSQLTSVENLVDERSEMLEDRERIIREVIIKESLPMWKLGEISKDSVKMSANIGNRIAERRIVTQRYLDYHKEALIVHLVIIILLALFFLFTKKYAENLFHDKGHEELGVFFRNYLSSAYLISFLLVRGIYQEFPQVVLELVLISLIPSIGFLLLRVVNKWQKRVFFTYFGLFILHVFLDVLPLTSLSCRLIFLCFQMLILAGLSLYIYHIRDVRGDNTLTRVIKLFSRIFWVTALVSILLNIIGSYQLSRLMVSGVVYSTGIGIVLILWFSMVKAIILLVLELPYISAMRYVKEHHSKLQKNLFNFAGVALFLLYLSGTTSQFEIQDTLIDGWNKIVKTKHSFGSVEISFQDFINFFLVLLITVFLARLLKYLFGREILVNLKLKRGMPNAVSMTVYYFVLVIGFFLAASSTGIEWSKLNVALGALGVGIGFGLQDVVFNFIAGLILIYERPIQVGDTIEIGPLMGTVTEIGIRSSKVLTYEGAEVIVPNGSLISKEVINWTYTDQLKRRELIIKTTYSATPSHVIEEIKGVLKETNNVLDEPSPLVLFTGYGDGTLDFRVLFWTHLDIGLSTGSNAAINIYDKLKEKGYEMPIQKRAIVVEDDLQQVKFKKKKSSE